MTMNAFPSDEPVIFLRHKSGVHKSRIAAAHIADVLLIDDSQFDGKTMSALLRGAFGRDVVIRHASSMMRAKTLLLERIPDLIVLDDIMPPKDRADNSLADLRQAGFGGLIIIVSGEMTRVRRLKLLQAGANEVLHKDDLNVISLVEAAIPRDQRPETLSVPATSDERIKELPSVTSSTSVE